MKRRVKRRLHSTVNNRLYILTVYLAAVIVMFWLVGSHNSLWLGSGLLVSRANLMLPKCMPNAHLAMPFVLNGTEFGWVRFVGLTDKLFCQFCRPQYEMSCQHDNLCSSHKLLLPNSE